MIDLLILSWLSVNSTTYHPSECIWIPQWFYNEAYKPNMHYKDYPDNWYEMAFHYLRDIGVIRNVEISQCRS